MDLSGWPALRLVEEIREGNRNVVWRGDLNGSAVSVRQSRRAPASLVWELGLIEHLYSLGFDVPRPIPTADGALHHRGVVVQAWLPGCAPASEADWKLVAAALGRLHAATGEYPQRPGCCVVTDLATHRRSVDADLDTLPKAAQEQVIEVFATVSGVQTAVIHGDPHSSNIRIHDGAVGLLDWDESRVDVIWHDLSNLGVAVLLPAQDRMAKRLSNAWEATNGWTTEPQYARQRLAALDD